MTPKEIANSLIKIHNTLNGIEVKGRENLNRLLGCMQELESMIPAVNGLADQPEVENEEHPAD